MLRKANSPTTDQPRKVLLHARIDGLRTICARHDTSREVQARLSQLVYFSLSQASTLKQLGGLNAELSTPPLSHLARRQMLQTSCSALSRRISRLFVS